jgi:hypothetical protein
MTLAVFAALALLARTAIADRVNTALEITGDTHMEAMKSSQVQEMSEIKEHIRELHKRVGRLEAAQVGTFAEGQGANATAHIDQSVRRKMYTAVLDARRNGVCCGAIDQSARRKMYTDFKWKEGNECKKAWHNTHVAQVDDVCCNEKSRTPGAITRSDWSTDCMPDGSPRATSRSCWEYHKGSVKDDNSCYCTKDFQHNNEEMQVGWLVKDTEGKDAVIASFYEMQHYGTAHCGPAYDAKFPFLSGCMCMPRWEEKDGRQLMRRTWSPSRRESAEVDMRYD